MSSISEISSSVDFNGLVRTTHARFRIRNLVFNYMEINHMQCSFPVFKGTRDTTLAIPQANIHAEMIVDGRLLFRVCCYAGRVNHARAESRQSEDVYDTKYLEEIFGTCFQRTEIARLFGILCGQNSMDEEDAAKSLSSENFRNNIRAYVDRSG